MILEVNDRGELILPPELVQAPPHTRLAAERKGESVVLKLELEPMPRRSILDLPTIPGHWVDQDVAFRREDIYGDDGR